jgi:hypothetical protein
MIRIISAPAAPYSARSRSARAEGPPKWATVSTATDPVPSAKITIWTRFETTIPLYPERKTYRNETGTTQSRVAVLPMPATGSMILYAARSVTPVHAGIAMNDVRNAIQNRSSEAGLPVNRSS